MGLTKLGAGLAELRAGLAELRAGLAELAGLVLLTELLISALTAHKCCHNESGLLRRRLQWASLNRLLVEFVRALEAVMRVFECLGRMILCVVRSTLIRSCARNGISSTASECASGATRKSADF